MMVLSRRSVLPVLVAASQAMVRPQTGWAQTGPWPSQSMRIIVVYPPGGLSDGMARALAEQLSLQLGVPVRVENRAGGGGSVGLQALARAQPDGHTLAFSAISPLTLRPHRGEQLHDPLRDIEPVASVMYTPVLLVATPAFAGRTFDALVQLARARPRALRWATSGMATAGHLVLEQVQLGSGIAVTHVPYKGGGQQLTDALGGQFELLSTNVAPAQLRYIEAGRLTPLAVGAPQRLDVLPRVPTFEELGLPHANVASLFGLFAPGGTSPALLDRLNLEINRALEVPAIRDRLVASDNLPVIGDRATFSRRIAQEWVSNRRLDRTSIKP
ncbi:Bug family tripartite tricarboxylate transporter substrate binding protein [Hydrogenophaga sp.]|uniref:Bug family tripartite tricarboxylate transporter substrate binding protein n=1 Tax=Hydrogenophaga sp. TaxID=1904254 RepID=UPI003D0D4F73